MADLLTAAISALGGAGLIGGAWGYLSVRAKANAPREIADGLATLADTVQKQTDALIDRMSKDIADLKKEVEDLKAENETCRTENLTMKEQISVLRSALVANNIPLEPHELPDSLIELKGGQATVLSAPRRRQRPAG